MNDFEINTDPVNPVQSQSQSFDEKSTIYNAILNRNIKYLKGVGPKRCELYSKLGIDKIYALLRYYPRNYIDLTKPFYINSAPWGESVAIKAKVYNKNGVKQINNKKIYKALATDGINNMTLTFFNNKYAYDALNIGDEYIFYGKVSSSFALRDMVNPKIIDITENKIKAIYKLTKGLSSKMISQNINSAFSLLKDNIIDPLPEEIIKENDLCSLKFALSKIHFPTSEYELEKAKTRLIFEEFFILALSMAMIKKNSRKKSTFMVKNTDLTLFKAALPFSLTDAQNNVINECLIDMQKSYPMARLVQGDVGSGKTIIAAAAAFCAIKSGFQVALMAPTEILANQHFKNLFNLFGNFGIKTALLTGSISKKEKDAIKSALKNGEIDFIIGTHAIIQKDVEFSKLGLVITDEQHRFGVAQRGMLAEKSINPHILVMSATPIPRSLALVIYGDLDISLVNQMPANRLSIETYLINSLKRNRMFGFIKKHIDLGKQVYIVCPAIDEGVEDNENNTELENVTQYYQKLKTTILKDVKTAILHGKLKPQEKDEIMTKFINQEIEMLISTTVIEVGVDVQNAVIMVIENAERFGLSQLHQLRGRVGRGSSQSFCILVSDDKNEETIKRLKTLCKNTDGFLIANEDLKLRGPGDFFGEKQHGLPELKIANLMTNTDCLNKAQKSAKSLLENDSDLTQPENSKLKSEVNLLFKKLTPGRIS